MKPTCFCGQAMRFPRYQNKSRCSNCGAKWESAMGGFWAEGLNVLIFTPNLTKECVPEKKDRYKNYPKARQKKRYRSRCAGVL